MMSFKICALLQIFLGRSKLCEVLKQKATFPNVTAQNTIGVSSLVSNVSSRMTWSRVCLAKLIFAQLVKKFLGFYGSHWFIIKFTRACHWPLS
jgi:hypothetical protein